MLVALVFSVLGICHGGHFVSFPDGWKSNGSTGVTEIVSGTPWKTSDAASNYSGNFIEDKPQSKNLAFLPIVVPVQPAPFPPAPIVTNPFPVWPPQSQTTPTYPTSISSPVNFGPAAPPKPAPPNPTHCSCTTLELCVSNYGSNVITTRIVSNPPPEAVCRPGEVYCCMEATKLGCGIPNIIPGLNPTPGQAHLGQFPWTAIILTPDNAYVAGGVLIDATHILSVAHRLVSMGNLPGLKVRFGDWDISAENEPVSYVEVPIAKMIHHPQFDAATLRNDITVITLAKPVATLTKPFPQINSICMPEPTTIFTGMRCKVAGWGKDQFDGKYQNIMKEVDVPVLSPFDCQARMREKLGASFMLDAASFLCAGGEPGKDACTGDGGNALACVKDGKYFVAGLTAAGIQCGSPNVPGLYVNLVNYVPWINGVIKGGDVVVINPRVNHP